MTAFGGGTLRDVMLGDLPVLWVRDPALLLNAVTVAILVFFLARRRDLPERLLLIADAGALALFTAIGVQRRWPFTPNCPWRWRWASSPAWPAASYAIC